MKSSAEKSARKPQQLQNKDMNHQTTLNKTRERRARRTRAKIKEGVRPRLSIFKSNKYMYAQIIDDTTRTTTCAVSSKEIEKKNATQEIAKKVGKAIAEKAKKEGLKEVVLDKGRYAYHGKIKAVAEGAREGGLKI
jgi:large subunit ribosomal protein L18